MKSYHQLLQESHNIGKRTKESAEEQQKLNSKAEEIKKDAQKQLALVDERQVELTVAANKDFQEFKEICLMIEFHPDNPSNTTEEEEGKEDG